jgi:tetraacyldisaccharide 4'-kinase
MYSPPAILRPVLFFPGMVYESVMRLRNVAYSTGRLKQRRLPGPVISIGNLTLGGAGKTPLAVLVAGIIAKFGYPIVLLSRGYGRRFGNRMQLVRPEASVSDPAPNLGDEPALIRRELPEIWMGIAKDRYIAGSQIAAMQPGSVFILDDGYQHRKLHRDLDLVILDPTQPFRTNSVFPRGTLREPIKEIRRSQVVIVNGASPADACIEAEQTIRSLHPSIRIFHCIQKIGRLIPFSDWKNMSEDPASDARGKSVFLAAAIGNPNRFQRDVEQSGIEVKGSRFFRDHHYISLSEWLQCAREARDVKAPFVLTTEKDAIKISHALDFPLLIARQSTSIVERDELEAILKSVVERVR